MKLNWLFKGYFRTCHTRLIIFEILTETQSLDKQTKDSSYFMFTQIYIKVDTPINTYNETLPVTMVTWQKCDEVFYLKFTSDEID